MNHLSNSSLNPEFNYDHTDVQLLKLLEKDLDRLQKSANVLSRSYETCKKFEVSNYYSYEELTELEALSSRFSRLVDLLVQKIFRTVDIINLAPEGTVRDSINRAEKNGLIDNYEFLVEMKQIRNQVAHEYVMEKLSLLFERIIILSPLLLDSIDRTIEYCKQKYF